MLEFQLLWLSRIVSLQELTEDGVGTAQWFHGGKKPFSQQTGTVLADGTLSHDTAWLNGGACNGNRR